MCVASVRFLLRHDRSGRLRFASLDSPAARALLAPFRGDEAARKAIEGDTVAMIERTRLWVRSDAALRSMACLGWPWKIASLLRLVPRRVRDHLYAAIASRRHSLTRRNDDCPLPDPGTAERFL
jgi:predicted DCC family thiol-disulfide oxidoreductase YuxK